MKRLAPVLLFSFLLIPANPALAANDYFQCEVLSVEGTATATDTEGVSQSLKQGDLLSPGAVVEVAADSYADLAYDKDWQNITRLEADSRIKISSVVPGKLDVVSGGVFAKLKKMPRDSSFEVRTPTAVATVRGTEYRTTFIDGKTDVFNASISKIYVAPVKTDGTVDRDNQVILREDKKTSVAAPGQLPEPPAALTPEEKATGQSFTQAIQKNIDTAVSGKREAKIQSVTQIEEFIKTERKTTQRLLHTQKEPELSRVTDERRRPFGGDSTMAPPEPPPAEEEPVASSEPEPQAEPAPQQ